MVLAKTELKFDIKLKFHLYTTKTILAKITTESTNLSSMKLKCITVRTKRKDLSSVNLRLTKPKTDIRTFAQLEFDNMELEFCNSLSSRRA